jgi:copper homeostasis protein
MSLPERDDPASVIPRAISPQAAGVARVTIEIMATSIAATRLALAGGAGRIELCDNYCEGGTTPSAATIQASCQAAREVGVPVMVMIRPRGGGFVYDQDEAAVMADDLVMALELGATGVVLGALDTNGEVDRALVGRLVALTDGAPVTFHRAVDVAADLHRAAMTAFELGANRVLTSGGAPTAPAGARQIAHLVAAAPPGCHVLAGGGVTAANAADLIAATGVREVHASARMWRATGGYRGGGGLAGVTAGPVPDSPPGSWPAPDPEEVRALVRAANRG